MTADDGEDGWAAVASGQPHVEEALSRALSEGRLSVEALKRAEEEAMAQAAAAEGALEAQRPRRAALVAAAASRAEALVRDRILPLRSALGVGQRKDGATEFEKDGFDRFTGPGSRSSARSSAEVGTEASTPGAEAEPEEAQRRSHDRRAAMARARRAVDAAAQGVIASLDAAIAELGTLVTNRQPGAGAKDWCTQSGRGGARPGDGGGASQAPPGLKEEEEGTRAVEDEEEEEAQLVARLRSMVVTRLTETLQRAGYPRLAPDASPFSLHPDAQADFISLAPKLLQLEALHRGWSKPWLHGHAWLMDALLSPFLSHFAFHFGAEERPTNRLDRPRWSFDFALTFLRNHAAFFRGVVQPILSRHRAGALSETHGKNDDMGNEERKQEEEDKGSGDKDAWGEACLMVTLILRARLRLSLPRLRERGDVDLCRTLDEARAFDDALRSMPGLKPGLGHVSCSSVFAEDPAVLAAVAAVDAAAARHRLELAAKQEDAELVEEDEAGMDVWALVVGAAELDGGATIHKGEEMPAAGKGGFGGSHQDAEERLLGSQTAGSRGEEGKSVGLSPELRPGRHVGAFAAVLLDLALRYALFPLRARRFLHLHAQRPVVRAFLTSLKSAAEQLRADEDHWRRRARLAEKIECALAVLDDLATDLAAADLLVHDNDEQGRSEAQGRSTDGDANQGPTGEAGGRGDGGGGGRRLRSARVAASVLEGALRVGRSRGRHIYGRGGQDRELQSEENHGGEGTRISAGAVGSGDDGLFPDERKDLQRLGADLRADASAALARDWRRMEDAYFQWLAVLPSDHEALDLSPHFQAFLPHLAQVCCCLHRALGRRALSATLRRIARDLSTLVRARVELPLRLSVGGGAQLRTDVAALCGLLMGKQGPRAAWRNMDLLAETARLAALPETKAEALRGEVEDALMGGRADAKAHVEAMLAALGFQYSSLQEVAKVLRCRAVATSHAPSSSSAACSAGDGKGSRLTTKNTGSE